MTHPPGAAAIAVHRTGSLEAAGAHGGGGGEIAYNSLDLLA
jgi:hypothetical protein